MNRIATLLIFMISTNTYAFEIIGKWKSDAELSRKYNEANAILNEKQESFIYQLFGNIVLEFKKDIYTSKTPDLKIEQDGKIVDFHGSDETYKYKLLAKDSNTVVIQSPDIEGNESLSYFEFESEGIMWIYLPSSGSEITDLNIREYFSRVK